MRGGSLAVVLAILAAASGAAQRGARDEPAVGAWRGTLRVADGAPIPLVLSVVRRDGTYAGAINLGGANEIALRQLRVAANHVAIECGAESKLGAIALAAGLTLEGTRLTGSGTLSVGPLPVAVTIELQRQERADVLQPAVEQRAAYFVGRWTFEYLGGEFPPLSPGSRAGTATFSSTSPHAVTGAIDGTVDGKPYREQWSMTFDPATQMLAVIERRAGGIELLSVANWQTPLAIRFTTAPVLESGRRYQLRRLLRIVSSTSFSVTEEFSVDGGPFRRLGHAIFEKAK